MTQCDTHDKHRFVRDGSLWLLFAWTNFFTQIATVVCGNIATVTSYQRMKYDVTVATLPHTAVVFRIQPFNCGMYIPLCDHFGITWQI